MRLRGEWISLSFIALISITGCSSKSSGTSSGAESAKAVSIELPVSVLVSKELKPLNESLNSSPNYALEASDVALLQTSGLLADEGDQAALTQLIKN